jgi:hypothetical protein
MSAGNFRTALVVQPAEGEEEAGASTHEPSPSAAQRRTLSSDVDLNRMVENLNHKADNDIELLMLKLRLVKAKTLQLQQLATASRAVSELRLQQLVHVVLHALQRLDQRQYHTERAREHMPTFGYFVSVEQVRAVDSYHRRLLSITNQCAVCAELRIVHRVRSMWSSGRAQRAIHFCLV